MNPVFGILLIAAMAISCNKPLSNYTRKVETIDVKKLKTENDSRCQVLADAAFGKEFTVSGDDEESYLVEFKWESPTGGEAAQKIDCYLKKR